MPKLWTDTIETHHRAVRDAAFDAVGRIVAERGLAAATMSEIADTAGVGRATLYKHFPDLGALLAHWHERHLIDHLAELTTIAAAPGRAIDRLTAALDAFARLSRPHRDAALAAQLHRAERVARAEQHVQYLMRDLIAAGIKERDIRRDIPPAELAAYCIHATTAAGNLTARGAIGRLVELIVTGLRRPGGKR